MEEVQGEKSKVIKKIVFTKKESTDPWKVVFLNEKSCPISVREKNQIKRILDVEYRKYRVKMLQERRAQERREANGQG